MCWGFKGTAASESDVGGRENTKHKPNTFGETFSTVFPKARRQFFSQQCLFSCADSPIPKQVWYRVQRYWTTRATDVQPHFLLFLDYYAFE
jgi:hypothetical protein